MLKILNATFILSLSTIIKLIIGIIKTKLTAIILLPSGVGIFSQANQFIMSITSITSLGIGMGVTKYTSEFLKENKKEKLIQTITTSLIIQSFLCIITILISIIFIKPISVLLFSDKNYFSLIIILLISIPFSTFSTLSSPIFFGIYKYKTYTISTILGLLLSFIPFPILILLYGLNGAIYTLLLTSIITFIVYFFYIWKEMIPIVENIGKVKLFDINLSINLVKYGITILINIMGFSITTLMIRSILISKLGPDANGYYQVAFALSGYYIPLVTNGIWGHFYPQMNILRKNLEKEKEINTTLRFCVLLSTPIILLILIFREFLINLIYSSEFLPAIEVINYQLLGDLFYVLSCIFSTSFLSLSKLWTFFSLNIMVYIISILFPIILIDYFSVSSVTIAYTIAHFLFTIISIILLRNYINFHIEKRNIFLIILSIVLIFIGIYINNNIHMMIFKILLLILWFFIVLSNDEKEKLYSKILQFLKK